MKKNSPIVSKEELFTKIWKTSYIDDVNTLYTHINFLRAAIEQYPSSPRYLLIVKGKGHILKEEWASLAAVGQLVMTALPKAQLTRFYSIRLRIGNTTQSTSLPSPST